MVTLLIGVFRPIYNWIWGPIFLPWMKKTLKNWRGLKICGLLFFRNARGAQSKTWEAGENTGRTGLFVGSLAGWVQHEGHGKMGEMYLI